MHKEVVLRLHYFMPCCVVYYAMMSVVNVTKSSHYCGSLKKVMALLCQCITLFHVMFEASCV